MKISAYIADLTAAGMTDDAARTFAKGQVAALSLVDDIGLTMPLASALVKGSVAAGLSEEDATEQARFAITKGKAVDDLAAVVTEPVTTTDAISQLEAASAELAKGYKQAEMELDDDDDDDEDGDDGSDDGKPEGLDGDDRGRPDTMPANGRTKKGLDVSQMAELLKGALVEMNAQAEAREKALNARIASLESTLNGIAKGSAAQGAAVAATLRGFEVTSNALTSLAKGLGEPRTPRGNVPVADVEYQPHPSETAAGAKRSIDRAGIHLKALAKGSTETDPAKRAQVHELISLMNTMASDADIQTRAEALGIAA